MSALHPPNPTLPRKGEGDWQRSNSIAPPPLRGRVREGGRSPDENQRGSRNSFNDSPLRPASSMRSKASIG